jgi:hypothetical protein
VEFAALGLDRAAKPDHLAEVGDICRLRHRWPGRQSLIAEASLRIL